MKSVLIALGFTLTISMHAVAQLHIVDNQNFQIEISIQARQRLVNSLNALFSNIHSGLSIADKIDTAAFNVSFFGSVKDMADGMEKDTVKGASLINLYPTAANQYFVSLAFVKQNSIKLILDLIVSTNDNKLTFSSPLWYYTRNWKTTTVGNIQYYYADSINLERAEIFDKKNTRMARNLGLQPEHLTFYLCDNYQELRCLMGFEYDPASAGKFREGYGIDTGGIIFSTMHNEDFSHDTFHYYSAKFRKNPRNSAADEGVAYSWGNAYYTDEQGEMILPKQLVPKLKLYLQQHPETTPLQLFEQNPLIFGPTSKVRSLLSSLLCDEVEKQKGIAGIKTLLDCGKGDDNYFRVMNDLIGVNKGNFDERIVALIR
jgi:hypothetical protein